MPYIIGGVVAVICAVLGFVSGSVHRRKSAEATIGSAEDEARRILSDAMKNAESKKKEALLEAKDEIHSLRQETEKDLRERRSEVQRQEHRIQQKEESLDRKTDNLEAKEENLTFKTYLNQSISSTTHLGLNMDIHNLSQLTLFPGLILR